MFTTQLRKVGNSWVVTVPREELDREEIPDGATVTVEVRKALVTVEPVLSPKWRTAAAWSLEQARTGLDYLAER
jgi:antitoxin component of MazEF toxin-antitoxin module